jgi:ABC-type multidrug transport system fused ATPase/permease subunit
VFQYAFNLEQETDYRVNGRNAVPDWPSEGKIKFQNASMRYRNGLPLSLKNASFDIGCCSKIGVGGKSFLMNALLRINEKARLRLMELIFRYWVFKT